MQPNEMHMTEVSLFSVLVLVVVVVLVSFVWIAAVANVCTCLNSFGTQYSCV